MKLFEKHITKFLLSIAIVLVFGNISFAAEEFSTIEKSTVSELQKNDQKPFVFNEIAIGEASQTVSQNEYLGLGFPGMFSGGQDFSFARISSAYNSSYFLKDQREFIFRHLFPFHFFW